jgi:hypothetical protein
MSDWNYGKPPNETTVEVEFHDSILRVQAIFGRDGTVLLAAISLAAIVLLLVYVRGCSEAIDGFAR